MSAPLINRLLNSIKNIKEQIEDTGWQELDLLTDNGVSATTSGYGGTCGIKYRKIGNHVYIKGSITISDFEGSNINVVKLPHTPNYQYPFFAITTGPYFVKMSAHTNGYLRVENWWDRAGTALTGAISWIAVNIDYWTDLD